MKKYIFLVYSLVYLFNLNAQIVWEQSYQIPYDTNTYRNYYAYSEVYNEHFNPFYNHYDIGVYSFLPGIETQQWRADAQTGATKNIYKTVTKPRHHSYLFNYVSRSDGNIWGIGKIRDSLSSLLEYRVWLVLLDSSYNILSEKIFTNTYLKSSIFYSFHMAADSSIYIFDRDHTVNLIHINLKTQTLIKQKIYFNEPIGNATLIPDPINNELYALFATDVVVLDPITLDIKRRKTIDNALVDYYFLNTLGIYPLDNNHLVVNIGEPNRDTHRCTQPFKLKKNRLSNS